MEPLPAATDLKVVKGNREDVAAAGTFLWRFAVYMHIPCNVLSIFKIVVVFAVCVTALLYYMSLDIFVEDHSYGIAVVEGQQARYLIESQRCSDVTRNCYTVYDAVDMFTGDVNRYLILQGLEEDYETVVRLIPPTGIKSKESDSRFWQVNQTHIVSQYVAVMLTVPFGVAALSSDVNQANVLIVGLGGGSMNMFLTSHFPKMVITVVELDPVVIHLAWRWFGLEKTLENVRTVVMDGAKFIEQAAARKVLFDAVMIDACGKDGDLVCPTKAFVYPNFIQNLKKILKPTGVVVLNVLSSKYIRDETDELVRKYQKEFPACVVARMLREANTVFACQLVKLVDFRSYQYLMSQRFRDAWNRFGFSRQFGFMEISFSDSKAETGIDS